LKGALNTITLTLKERCIKDTLITPIPINYDDASAKLRRAYRDNDNICLFVRWAAVLPLVLVEHVYGSMHWKTSKRLSSTQQLSHTIHIPTTSSILKELPRETQANTDGSQRRPTTFLFHMEVHGNYTVVDSYKTKCAILLWSEFIYRINVYLHFLVLIYFHITFIILIVYYFGLICMNTIYTHLCMCIILVITYLIVKCCTFVDFSCAYL
jgi:hypothetical protein